MAAQDRIFPGEPLLPELPGSLRVVRSRDDGLGKPENSLDLGKKCLFLHSEEAGILISWQDN